MLIETKVKATKFVNEVINVKSKMEQLLSKNDYNKINDIIELMKKEIKNNNKEKIDELIEKLNNSTKKFAQKMIDKNFQNLSEKKLIYWRNNNDKNNFYETVVNEKVVDAQNGLSLLEVAHNNGISLEGACEGSLACSTCHVIVETGFEKLPEPSEEEEDMLDLAWGATSRLGCQIIINDSLDGMKVKVPTGTRNMSVKYIK